jgi:uncharacterized BrkB/YihY/UPF0761 family membrane protein
MKMQTVLFVAFLVVAIMMIITVAISTEPIDKFILIGWVCTSILWSITAYRRGR